MFPWHRACVVDQVGYGAWFVIFGGVLLFMGLSTSWVQRLPLTTSIVYLGLGALLGPLGLGRIHVDAAANASGLELITEICVSLSLFTAGLKLRLPWTHPRWRTCLRLAFVSMAITIVIVALLGVYGLGLPWGAAILLGAILAPTDPVLASDVQVQHSEDSDALRFSLTGEAGFNDGAAFPFVMLGLGMLGLHDLGDYGWKWFLVDVVWAIPAGFGVGTGLGILAAKGIVYLRRHHKEAVVLDDFLALGLLSISYGAALAIHAYAFLAAFAAGLALRMTERRFSGAAIPDEVKEAAHAHLHERAVQHPEHAPAYAAQAILLFNEQLERLGEVGLVILLGAMLSRGHLVSEALWFVPTLFLLVRPLSVALGAGLARISRSQFFFMGWFGIRGIGSLYYLAYVLARGLPPALADRLVPLVLSTVAASVLVHGISVTPLMKWRVKGKRTGVGEPLRTHPP